MSKGRLGATVMSLSPELRGHFGSSDGTGVLVSHVDPGTPAARAGIEVGDMITRVGGKVVDDAGDVLTALADVGAGKHVAIDVVRDKKLVKLDATLGENDQTSMARPPVFDWLDDFLRGAFDGAAKPAT